MKRTVAMCALSLVVGACSGSGGNPFTDGDTDEETPVDETPEEVTVPEGILKDLTRINFNADDNTLTVTGLTLDGTPLINDYTPVANTFVEGYTTFTGQNDPLGRHATAFVASRDGVQAGVVVTGGQFNTVFGGAYFERTGAYVAPTEGQGAFDVTYYGRYAGGLNLPGPETDLQSTTGLGDNVNRSTQAGYVRGLMFVNVDFDDMAVEGEIYGREGVRRDSDDPSQAALMDLPDLVLVDGVLTDNGTFSGNIEVDATDDNEFANDDPVGQDIGIFAGVIGGPDRNAMAGGTYIETFTEQVEEEIEYGVFVLDLCVAGDTDPICVNALQP